MGGRDMDTEDKKISVAASEYIQRRAAFWLAENRPENDGGGRSAGGSRTVL